MAVSVIKTTKKWVRKHDKKPWATHGLLHIKIFQMVKHTRMYIYIYNTGVTICVYIHLNNIPVPVGFKPHIYGAIDFAAWALSGPAKIVGGSTNPAVRSKSAANVEGHHKTWTQLNISKYSIQGIWIHKNLEYNITVLNQFLLVFNTMNKKLHDAQKVRSNPARIQAGTSNISGGQFQIIQRNWISKCMNHLTSNQCCS